MLVVSVISEKGGVGKTTAAVSLAVAAGADGKRAAIIDTDPQATAAKWTDRRDDEFPWVATAPSARLRQAVDQAKAQGIDFLVIDTPPHAGADAAEAARLADVVVVPVEPHIFSLETVEKTKDVLKLAGDPLAFVLITKAPIQGRDAQTAAAHLTSLGLPVCPTVLHNRAAHRHAGNAGQSAAEFEPDGKAAEEVTSLYTFTTQFVEEKSHGQAQPTRQRA